MIRPHQIAEREVWLTAEEREEIEQDWAFERHQDRLDDEREDES